MAAGRDELARDFDRILSEYDPPAVFLALALQDEDADKFVEVYDHVVPKNLSCEEVEIIKEKAREFATLPPATLASLKQQCSQPVVDLTRIETKSTVLSKDVAEIIQETCTGTRVLFSPTKCAALEMEGSTPTSGTSACRNVPCKSLSESDKIWNNNNNIETYQENFVTAHDLSNGNGEDYLSNTDCAVLPESVYPAHCNNTSQFVTHYSSNLHSKSLSVAPYSKQELLQSAVELIDCGSCLQSNTCPKPAFINPNKPGQVLQVQGGLSDMATAASSASTNTKKTELKGVRLTSTVKTSSPLPNGSINNKKLGVSTLQRAAASSTNSVPNDETPLMGNSQRTDSSVCVKQYGTNVPSNPRQDYLQSTSGDSDELQDKSKLSSEEGDLSNKPATLGEQFEASKIQEGKKKKSKKKKKNKVQEAEKPNSPSAVVNNDKQDDNFQDALAELPPTKKSLISSDSLTSNEELSTDATSSVRETIASKMMHGIFHVKEESKTSPAVKSAQDNPAGSSNLTGEVVANDNKKEDATGDDCKASTSTTQITQTKVSQTTPPEQTDTAIKTVIPDNLLSNNRKFALLNSTPHEINDQTFHDAQDSTNDDNDDGEFQEVKSSRKSRRFRNKKGASMEDKLYPYQNKQFDKDRGTRGFNSSFGMRKSSSEPAGMARLGDIESELHSENNYLRKLASKNTSFKQDSDKHAQRPTKQNLDFPSGSISYAGKVKAGIVPRFQQSPKSSNPVKFTLDDEHSDGHVSDSSLAQNDASLSQRTIANNPNSSIVLNKEAGLNAKITPETSPKFELARTSPKFEISFGEFPSVNISGAPKSLKASSYGTTLEGLVGGNRPFQKVTRSNSVDGLETDGTGNVSNNPSSTTQHHQEANVQYLDLQSTNNTYAGMLKRRLPSKGSAAATAVTPKPKPINEPLQTCQVAAEVALPPESTNLVVENQKLVDSGLGNKKTGLDKMHNQVKSTQQVISANSKVPANSTCVDNKSHQEVKAAAHISSPHVIASPTPSITSSSKGAASSVCFPLSMEPMDLGITFGDVNISEVLKEVPPVRQDSPVDKILAGAAAVSATLPEVPSTGHSCTDLESAWRDENKDPHLGGSTGDAANRNHQRLIEPQSDGYIGRFNYYEVANMLMKAWMSTVEQKEANPSKVQYYVEPADACI